MIPRQIIINLVEGDDAPPLSFRFSGLTLSDYSSIFLRVRIENTRKRIARQIVPDGTDPELGTVSFSSGDLVRGRHEGEIEFLQTDGKRFTVPSAFPIIFSVRGDIG